MPYSVAITMPYCNDIRMPYCNDIRIPYCNDIRIPYCNDIRIGIIVYTPILYFLLFYCHLCHLRLKYLIFNKLSGDRRGDRRVTVNAEKQ